MKTVNRWLRLTLCALLCCSGVVTAVAAEVRDLRVWQSSDDTRLVLDLSRVLPYKVFALQHPDRIVIDLEDAKAISDLTKNQLTEAPIKSIRIADRQKSLRIVLETTQLVKFSAFMLAPEGQYGHRLVVDLIPPQSSSAAIQADPLDAFMASKIDAVKNDPNPSDNAKNDSAKNNNDSNKPDVASSTKKTKPYATPALTQANKNLRDIVIAIDAGHGGEDPGAIGSTGIREKDVVLAIARQLYRAFDKEPGFKPALTRDGDYFIELANRSRIAKEQYNADLFISVHADSWENHQARGASVYILSRRGATSTLARYLADSENSADLIGNISLRKNKDDTLRNVLADLAMEGSLEHSLEAGHSVLGELSKVTSLHKSGIEQAGFVVLKSLHMPSMLVETGFVSNDEESKRLNDEVYQAQLASAIKAGIKRYFENQPPPGTYLAAKLNQSQKLLASANVKKHRISRGETLSSIAQKYNVSPQDIKLANELDSDDVRIGQLISIPDTVSSL